MPTTNTRTDEPRPRADARDELADGAAAGGEPVADGEKVREHLDFLTRMAAEGAVPPPLAEVARDVWCAARRATADRLPVPAASTFEGGPIHYNWDRGEHHLEAEFPAAGPVEWFYRNWNTNEVWSADVPAGDPLLPALVVYLGRIIDAS